MLFSSLVFLFVYLPIVLAIYFLTPLKLRNLMLLLANVVFYAWGEPIYILIMVFSTFVDYTHGILIEKFRDNDKKARFFVASSVIINLSILIFFKYYDFIIKNLTLIFPSLPLAPLGLALPIGISFYTFQTMSYTIDVYRHDARVQKNIINFGTYVTLFPQLIAGPIVKYKDVANELDHRSETFAKFKSGVVLFVIGLGKKVLLANNIGALWDTYKLMPKDELTILGAWLGIIAFSLQIYFDFSGYSDMARGLGRMLGFEFMKNFDYPYISKSLTEFWRRWHISLGSWFREYVYIPLGGNKKGALKTFRNIFLVWLLTGIWHGAEWNFLFWGLFFAVMLMVEKLFLLNVLKKLPSFVSHIYTLFFIAISWVIFAVEGGISEFLPYIKAMLGFAPLFNTDFLYYLTAFLPIIIISIFSSTPLILMFKIGERSKKVLTFVFVLFVLILSTAYLVDASYNPFLYFRF